MSKISLTPSIRPYGPKPKFWQYRGQPVMLLGGSKEDNLFQIDGLAEHLDVLSEVGGNYIRNVMSSRDEGDVWPFGSSGESYDLETWNEDYWRRFERLLILTEERDIIVQIEVWDRFDFSREPWTQNPFNPANNDNYTSSASGLNEHYPDHPSSDVQPFFHTVPGMDAYRSAYDVVRRYQERFVDKLLSYSLRHPNVLFCMNNETSTSPLWGKYWIGYIREHARSAGVEVYQTDMFDGFWNPETCPELRTVVDEVNTYDFVDASQVNSRNFARKHWETARYVLSQVGGIRPVNNTKVYGSGNTSFGSGTSHDGVERFIRNVLAGCAAVRFHRPTSGNGLNTRAQAAIRALRIAEEYIAFWELEPRMDLVSQWYDNGAYLAAKPGEQYLLYFTNGRTARLNLESESRSFALTWIELETAERSPGQSITGGTVVDIRAPGEGGWLAAIVAD